MTANIESAYQPPLYYIELIKKAKDMGFVCNDEDGKPINVILDIICGDSPNKEKNKNLWQLLIALNYIWNRIVNAQIVKQSTIKYTYVKTKTI